MHFGHLEWSADTVLVVWVIDLSPARNWIAWALVAPAVVLSLLSILIIDPLLLIGFALLEAALYFYGESRMVAYMTKDYRVTTDELFAADASFTLLAWEFGFLYLICSA